MMTIFKNNINASLKLIL